MALLCMARVEAKCLGTTDPEIQHLRVLMTQDPAKALAESKVALERLQRAPGSPHTRIAALYAVQAHTYSLLELDHEARKAAAKGLELAPDPRDLVHLDLLIADAENVYDQAGLNQAIKTIQSSRLSQTPGSVADTCLLITLGVLQYRQNHAADSIVNLMQAYRASSDAARAEQRVLAAAALSSVMRSMGDYEQALALNQEVIDWDSSHGATLSLSVSRFLRGSIFVDARDYASALDELTAARALSVQLRDEQGIAFADMNLCDAHIELGHLSEASARCMGALPVFEAAQSTDVVKRTQALLARIDLEQGRADQALAKLNDVLGHGGEDIPARQLVPLYRLRARANSALHRYQPAYVDLDEYVTRYAAASEAERVRQATALRARFGTDREIERNASLQRELAFAQELSRRQTDQLRWTAIGIVAGMLFIALLTYILFANLRHRRQLQQLADQDALTGLANRRRTADLATQALAAAAREHEPLTVALIDLDHFKAINDCCGHAAGDHVLKEFADLARRSVRATDILGRWGGEEFLLVMPGVTLDLALISLERLREIALRIELPPTGTSLRVSLSAGLAMNDGNVRSLDDVVARADLALYTAKNDGRNLVRVADENLRTSSSGVRRALRARPAMPTGS